MAKASRLGVCSAQLCPALSSSAGPAAWLSPVLLPGVGLYVLLNGSLLFGSGLGRVGEFVVFVVGSAVAWASLLSLLVLLVQVAETVLKANTE